MRKTTILPLLCLTSTLALAACSKPADRNEGTPPMPQGIDAGSRAPAADAMASAEAGPTPPGISPTAAPGVAFNYRYDFRLDAARIGEVQEKHAQACEKLGVDRCRIAGMRYELMNDRDIAAQLVFKLEPSLARQFGKDGIGIVTAAEGMNVRTEITGVDAGAAIGAAGRARGRLLAERTRLEAQLKQPGLDDAEQASIRSRLEDIARQIDATNVTTETNEESLATTPMVFNYGSGEVAPGFDGRSPIRDAIRTAADTFLGAIAALIVVAGALLPLALLGLLIWGLWLLVRPRLQKLRTERPEPPAPKP